MKVFFTFVVVALSLYVVNSSWVGKSVILTTTELWDNATYQNFDVANSFFRVVYPVLAAQQGFQEYTAGFTSSRGNIFFGVFDTANELATAITAGETAIAADPAYHEIQMDVEESGVYYFHYVADETDLDLEGKYLLLHYWALQEASTWTPAQVLIEVQTGFAPAIQQQPGFNQYAGILLYENPNHVMFYIVFDTLEQAAAANSLAADLVISGPLAEQIHIVVNDTAAIAFDDEAPTECPTCNCPSPSPSPSPCPPCEVVENQVNFVFAGMLGQ